MDREEINQLLNSLKEGQNVEEIVIILKPTQCEYLYEKLKDIL